MAKSYKPIGETYSRNRPCLRCFNCKTRVFRDLDELKKWCQKREFPFSYAWKKRLIKDKMIQIYWCTKSYAKPRIFRASDTPFIVCCMQFDGGDVDGNT